MRTLRILLPVVAAVLALEASGAVLVQRSAPGWRWRPGTNEASAPVTAWRTLGFDDSQFTTAPAPFWFDTANPPDSSTLVGGTQITGMANVYTSLFLRVTFMVTNTAEVAYLRLGALVDDGFVAWINGTEVQRVNMIGPAGDPVSITTLASNPTEPVPFNTYTLPTPPSYLVTGSNVLAVQVFQSSATSSDLDFDASLESVLVETNPPTVLSASPTAGGTVGGLSTITVTFSEPVAGVDAADFLVNGVAAMSVTPISSAVYSFGFAQPAYGTVQITWDASHGITDQALPPNQFNATGPGATWQYNLVDQTPPTVATLSPPADATVRSLTNISVVFSENVTGVNAADLRINNTPATGLSGGANVYTFSFPQPATGLVQVAWAAGHGITDLAAAPNAFAGGSWLYTLDPNAAVGSGPVISEFLAFNITAPGSLLDEDGDSSDWIEIQNLGNTTANLLDWSLTDETNNPTKWRFPATNMLPGGFLVVFASEKDRRVPGARLHTNFKLDGQGEYLALIRPDGSKASEFAPFPQQVSGVSYGLGVLSTNSTLVPTNALVRVRIPSSGADGTNWLYPGFNDGAWTAGTNGVGYGTTNVTAADYSATVLPTGPVGYWRLDELSGSTAANLGSGAGLNGTYTSATLGTAGPRPQQFNGFEPNNYAPTFNGSSSFISTPSPLLNNRSTFTMAGWIRPTVAQAARSGLFGQNDLVEFGFISATTIQLWTFVGQIDFAYPFGIGEWHHIAAVGTGTQLQLFLDGTMRATAAMSGAIGTSADHFNIGGGGIFDTIGVNGNYFNGQIDEVAVYYRALSSAEVLSLYQGGTNAFGVSVVPYIRTDVAAAMSNINASAYIRLPFTIDDPSNVQLLSLKMRYDDGFVAYLNGIELARVNAPGTPAFNSTATGTHTAIGVDQFQSGGAVLRGGANVLAIQGLNTAAADEDFLVSAELTATHVAAATSAGVYMTVPSPGSANGSGVSVLGPAITEPSHSPNVPLDSQDLLVTARVSPTFALIGSVAVRYRVMFGAETELSMFDDGTHGDALANDGVYSQTLPVAAASTNGQMIRWYFRATDGLGNSSRWPLFLSAVDTEYLGTIVDPTNVTSQLPIFHLFVAPGQIAGIDTETGGRLSFFHDGEFYDNIYMELRGNTSAGLPKKAHRLEFNRDHELRHPGPGGRIRKTSLLAEFPDPSRIRQHVCFWFLDKIGVPSPFDYPVRVQTNATFYQLAFHNDVIGQEQVARLGFDIKGAIYKAAGNVDVDYSSTGVYQHIEPDPPDPEAEPFRGDYNQLARGINDTNLIFAVRKNTVFDLLDVPEVVNYLVGARWCSENDDVWANMSLYRDRFGDQLWRIIPFDMNASMGQRYGGVSILEANVDNQKSHPLYGGRSINPLEGHPADYFNRIYDVIISVPETRQMLLRRMRTVMDKWVLPPGTPTNQLIIENYIKSVTNLIAADAALDNAKWGNGPWGPNEPILPACSNIIANFVGPRRTHWYVTHCITNTSRPIGTNATQNAGIPLTQSVLANIAVASVEANPASSNQAQEFLCITNLTPAAVDITDWKLAGGVEFKFKPGTVIPSNSVIYVSPDVVAFKQRTTGPRGGQGLFVVGPYDGQLSARGEPLTIRDDHGRLVYSNTYPAAPSPAQQFLRVSEIMYNPSALAGNTNDPQEFEYIELVNNSPSLTLDLNGVRLTNGVDFAFTGSAITSLGPNGRVVVVRNLVAFTARYGALANVAGQYAGLLDNAGERIRLLDASNEEVLDFSYNNSWYPITDGLGFSLVNTNLMGEPDSWGHKSSWRPSGALQGAPGQSDPPGPSFAPIRISEVLTHTDPPQRDTIELFNPTASPVNIGGWFLSDDFTNALKFRITNGCVIPAGGFVTFDETLLTNPATALVPFALSSLGDEVFIFSGDPASTNLTGYRHGFNFGAADNGVSFGLYVDSQTNEHFVAQKTLSLGSANAGPRVGPVVLTEIMFHPPDNGDGSDNSIDEFIELRSITNAPTPLFTPTNNWRLSGGIRFDFPFGATLGANTSLVVVAFNPTNGTQLASFRSRFNVPAGVPVYGPFDGKLDNSSDKVRLQKPGDAAPNGAPSFILVDEVDYQDSAPWPSGADGSGASLQRRVAGDFGNDPANWVAATVTGGGLWSGGALPTISAQPSATSAGLGLSAMFSISASGPGPLGYQWRHNGNSIAGANSSILLLSGIDFFDEGLYDVVVYNAAGSVASSSASLSVFIPAEIQLQPQSVEVRVRPDLSSDVAPTTNVTFSMSANTANPPLTFQWQMNGTNMLPSPRYAGINSMMLTISNVVMADFGLYACAVTDGSGTLLSSSATLYPLVRPTILIGPVTNTVPAFSPVPVSVVLSNGWPPPFGYTWFRGSTPFSNVLSGSKTNFIIIPPYITSNLVTATTFSVRPTNRALIAPLSANSSFFTITTLADTDRDGIPDSVEQAYVGNATSFDPAADLDGDGMTNLAEYQAGTDINDNASYLRIEQSIVPGTATVWFAAVSNRTYTIQYTDTLPPAWSKLADFVALRTNRLETVTDPAWSTNRFYRVATPWQP
jgi:hypothetical protein